MARSASATLQRLARGFPVLHVTGPRQSGKTTLARHEHPDLPYRSLDGVDVRSFAADDPRGSLAQFPGGAILNEVQRVPDLLSSSTTREQVTITKKGVPAAVLVGVDEWEALQETHFWLSKPGIRESISEATRDVSDGRLYSQE